MCPPDGLARIPYITLQIQSILLLVTGFTHFTVERLPYRPTTAWLYYIYTLQPPTPTLRYQPCLAPSSATQQEYGNLICIGRYTVNAEFGILEDEGWISGNAFETVSTPTSRIDGICCSPTCFFSDDSKPGTEVRFDAIFWTLSVSSDIAFSAAS